MMRPTLARHATLAVAAARSRRCRAAAGAAAAQQRPLVTEDPETIGAGRVLLEAGLDYGRGVEYPVSGLTGHLLRVPLIGVSVGISSIAELQFDGGLYNRLTITERDPAAPLASMVTATGDSTSSVEDLVIATKVRVLSEREGRPAFGLRFATKLPNASNESGIGLDTMDFTGVAPGRQDRALGADRRQRRLRHPRRPGRRQPAERRHHLRRVAGARAHAGRRSGRAK